MPDCLIAFGANEGDPQASYQQAVRLLASTVDVDTVVAGEPMVTEPVGGPVGQPSYLNAAIRLTTNLGPAALHERLVEIETELGRERRVRWGARTIDLDLLLYDQQTITTDTLTVPHPRMSFRRFVLEPCTGIASDVVHVTSGKTIAQLLEHLDSRSNVIAWVNPDAKLLQELAVDDSLAGWTFVPVDTVDQFAGFEELVKLVIVGATGKDDDELETRSLRFAGPMLDLRNLIDPTKEIAAAIAAM